MNAPHPIFESFTRWDGDPLPGFQTNWIGAHSRTQYVDEHEETRGIPDYPQPSEDVFEWIDVLEAVDRARGRFVMAELGAGYGRWLVNAALAARQRGLDVQLVAVEAEPTRVGWLREHFADNAVDPTRHRIEHAAAAGSDGHALFQTGKTDSYYGQRLVRRARNFGWPLLGGRLRRVPTVSLASILRDLDRVDLVDLDVEGAEAEVLTAAADAINAKVAAVHVGTHTTAVEHELRALFQRLGWRPGWDFPIGATLETDFGRVWFENGVQSWRNPHV